MVHNAEMETVVYCCLGIVFVACVCLAVFLLHGPMGNETWPALTAVLAVIAVLPALAFCRSDGSMTEQQLNLFDTLPAS